MNNSEYVIPYFVKYPESFFNYVLRTDLTIFNNDVELNIYLSKNNWYIRNIIKKEPNFSRFMFKNGNMCAVFNSPKKYKGIIHCLSLCGNEMSKLSILNRNYQQQKTLASYKRCQGFFILYLTVKKL